MDFQEASRLLDRIAPGEHLWKRHSHQVAQVALVLGEGLIEAGQSLDLPAARASALFHDVGRSVTHGPLHGWTGYVILRKHGAAEFARGCIVHWTKGQTIEEFLAEGRLTPRFLQKLYADFDLPNLTLADKLVALSDALVRHDEVVTLEDRLADVTRRYGASDYIARQFVHSRAYQNELEALLGRSISGILAPLMGGSLKVSKDGSSPKAGARPKSDS